MNQNNEMLHHIFHHVLPREGYTFRQSQAELAEHILDAIGKRRVSLSEAEVGTGKTHAYLIAAALAKRQRINDSWLRGIHPGQGYADSLHMPVVIATSSIALQDAIVKDYIPEISRILLEHGIIETPLSAVIRKGREHYLCQRRLFDQYMEGSDNARWRLLPLFAPTAPIDLSEADNLTPYLRRRIGASGPCPEDCGYREEQCRFQRHLAWVQSNQHDFQVCNHNYLLADLLRRRDGKTPLIPHYQAVVIDEAHKFLQAARQMYGVELGSEAIPAITHTLRTIQFQEDGALVWKKAKKLYGQHQRLFALLRASGPEEPDRVGVDLENGAAQHLHNIRAIAEQLLAMLDSTLPLGRHRLLWEQARWDLAQLRDRAAEFAQPSALICWAEQSRADRRRILGAIPRDLGKSLHRDFWSMGIPVILTSGTLSAAGSFQRIRISLGLDRLPKSRVMETSKPSPFLYRDNVLLYVSSSMPFPDSLDADYPAALAAETERLIRAAHGHAAVLFTSYKTMDMVWELLSRRRLPFPLFRLDRGGVGAIAEFRESHGGVLFASGAMWEGIDIPGDALSLLIIVRLPFAVPDPISQYERSLYASVGEYKRSVVVPDMLMRLRQGFGRLIRLESDTGVAAFLDSRMGKGGAYRARILAVLPRCPVTDDPEAVAAFLRKKKHDHYFYTNNGRA